MRVALVFPTTSDPAHRRVASELGAALRARGHRVSLHHGEGRRPGEARGALAGALERGIDVCHVQCFSRGLAFLEGLSWPASARVVLTHQGADPGFLERPGLFSRLARRADAVTTVSARGLTELARRFPAVRGKAAVVFNGVELDGAAPRFPGPRPFLLCVGRLAAYKGIDVLLHAFAGLARRHPALELRLCGPDQTAGRLRAFSARLGLLDRVRFLGPVGPARVRRLLSGCLAFVQPSRRENLPLALLEAMAAGAPIVATRAGGVPEAVQDGRSALIVEPGDAVALEGALGSVLADAGLGARLGGEARRRAGRFAWSRVAADYERVYLNSRPRATP